MTLKWEEPNLATQGGVSYTVSLIETFCIRGKTVKNRRTFIKGRNILSTVEDNVSLLKGLFNYFFRIFCQSRRFVIELRQMELLRIY